MINSMFANPIVVKDIRLGLKRLTAIRDSLSIHVVNKNPDVDELIKDLYLTTEKLTRDIQLILNFYDNLQDDLTNTKILLSLAQAKNEPKVFKPEDFKITCSDERLIRDVPLINQLALTIAEEKKDV